MRPGFGRQAEANGEQRNAVLASAGDHSIGTYAFQVEEFVPERMKVTVGAPKNDYPESTEVPFEISARYLFGATPSGEKVELSCSLEPAVFRPKENSK